MGRPSKDEYWLAIALAVATRSTCLRRSVGCVLVDARGHVLSTGYNGNAAGLPHCNEHTAWVDEQGRAWKHYDFEWYDYPREKVLHRLVFEHACAGAFSPSGSDLDRCEAVHAEVNACTQCRDAYAIETAYVTTAPCVSCVKQLMGTSARRIVFVDDYPHAAASRDLWLRNSARKWEQHAAPGWIASALQNGAFAA